MQTSWIGGPKISCRSCSEILDPWIQDALIGKSWILDPDGFAGSKIYQEESLDILDLGSRPNLGCQT